MGLTKCKENGCKHYFHPNTKWYKKSGQLGLCRQHYILQSSLGKPRKGNYKDVWAYQKAEQAWRLKQCTLETSAFYELMQEFRNSPLEKHEQVEAAFKKIKSYIRNNKKKIYTQR